MASVDEPGHRGKGKAKETAPAKPASEVEQRTQAEGEPETEPKPEPRPQHLTLRLPLTTVEIRAPQLPQAPRVDVGATVRTVREAMPPPAEIAYFAGLGLLGVLDVLEWPVVLAVGAGTVIAQRITWTYGRRPEPVAAAASGD